MHVLIIEDEPLIALNIQCLLEELGADSTEIADSEDEALASACDHRPDLITADYSLREGTGLEAVKRIKQQCGTVPVIFITGQPERCELEDGDETVAIPKPILWLDLVQAFGRHGLPH